MHNFMVLIEECLFCTDVYPDLLPCNELVSEYGLDDTGEAMVYLHQTPTAKEQ